MYHVNGLNVLESPFDAQQTEYIVEYCWSYLRHVDLTTNEVIYLYHYAYFPYIMFLFFVLFYVVDISWRFSSFNELAHGTFTIEKLVLNYYTLISVLDHILDGLEEQIRDILQLLIEDIKGGKNSVSRINVVDHRS